VSIRVTSGTATAKATATGVTVHGHVTTGTAVMRVLADGTVTTQRVATGTGTVRASASGVVGHPDPPREFVGRIIGRVVNHRYRGTVPTPDASGTVV